MMKIVIVAINADNGMGLKVMPLAPWTLKSHLDNTVGKELQEKYSLEILIFEDKVIDIDKITKTILAKAADVVGFSAFVWNFLEELQIAQLVKKQNKDSFVLFGGPQVYFIADQVLEENFYIDAVVNQGKPGEMVFSSLIKALLTNKDLSGIPGLSFRGVDGEIINNPPLTSKDYNLDDFPYPFVDTPISFSNDNSYLAILEGSRGCPWDCGFCVHNSDRKYLNFNLSKVLSAIDNLVNNQNVRAIYFADSNFIANPQRARMILEHIICDRIRFYLFLR